MLALIISGFDLFKLFAFSLFSFNFRSFLFFKQNELLIISVFVFSLSCIKIAGFANTILFSATFGVLLILIISLFFIILVKFNFFIFLYFFKINFFKLI